MKKDEPTLEVNDRGGYFDLAPTDLADNTRREIVNVLTEIGILKLKQVTTKLQSVNTKLTLNMLMF